MTSNRKKHILFLASWYPSRTLLDDGDFIQRHAKSASLLNKITVLHAIKDPNLKQNFELFEARNEIREVIVYFSPNRFRPFNFFKKISAYFIGLKHIEDFDLIHLNVTYPAGIIALFLKWFKNRRYVITEHWTGFRADAFAKLPFGERFAIKTILKNASNVLPVSDDLRKQILRVAPNIKSTIVPNVINTDIFAAKNTKKQTGNRKHFLHISNLKDEHKNIAGMLNVALRLTKEGFDFEFHIGGNGDWKSIQTFIDKYKMSDKVFTFGRLTHEEVAEKMQQSDCFILFSNYETQGIVVQESFACGIPVIAPAIESVIEYFPENFGIKIKIGNEDSLFNAMREIINGRTFASAEIMNAYEQQFSANEIAKRFDDIYNEVLA